jgi:hypothetical protein
MDMDPLLKVFWCCDFFSKKLIYVQKENLPYPFTIYPFINDRTALVVLEVIVALAALGVLMV